ncbi:flagellin N-terminal helical domain-containing protein [Botrimarina hoheduenensis]|uniref:Flagellin n=1 Tax=Botrimarina hoheduenensis TaxID=2528000 RepID=A0A5C5VVK5_9BACT|nr:flagellin [Botrimarina hoheduenensis]TWT42696.1 A-type flagellin [Botrimarina hoheduenensis]
MTRINTNVSSLVGRNNLQNANASLSQSLTRLSTGLRINTGKDDPAGLIASENLRSDITSIRRAIGNTDRANQVIATADSALGQVSSLLNDIRGLVTESANSGALSDEQIAANQLQVDSSLEALNRIAQTTTFQGRRLLDGSLDFTTTAGTNFSNISNLQIDQANLGATGSVAVDVNVTTAATQATVGVANIPAGGAATASTGSLAITAVSAAAQASSGQIDLSIAATAASGTIALTNGGFDITAATAGAAGNTSTLAINIVDTTSSLGATYDSGTNTITVNADITNDAGNWTVGDIATAIDGLTEFDTSNVTTPAGAGAAQSLTAQSLTGGEDASTESITVTGAAAGISGNVGITIVEANGTGATPVVGGDATNGYTITIDDTVATSVADITSAINGLAEVGATSTSTRSFLGSADTAPAALTLSNGSDQTSSTETIAITTVAGNTGFSITLAENSSATAGTPVVTGDATNGYTVTVNDTGNTTVQQIRAAIEGIAEVATATYSGSATYNATNSAPPSALALTGGTAAGGLSAAVVFELAGANGSEVLSFGVGTSLTDLIAGINLVSDATGVRAAANATTATTLDLTSSGYGSNAFVDISVISEGTGATPAGTFTTAVGQGQRSVGADVVASVNGVVATGNGNELSINTATLDLSATLTAGFTGTSSFTISGGGALFQLGPDVVSNQQARLGIGSVNTARLGGTSGKLFQLGTGGLADLSSDPTTAARIVEDAIDQVTSLRGRLGAFQRTSLETNKNALNDTLTNLTEAESSIRDADFAEETANLTRSQILVQSGTRVLAIANQNPQNVLALLG